MYFKINVILIYYSFFSVVCQASTLIDYSTGVRISIGAAQTLLVSPPLPSLEATGGITFTPQLGTTKVKSEGKENVPALTTLAYFLVMVDFVLKQCHLFQTHPRSMT